MMTQPDNEAFWTRVMALAEGLDAMSYYHLLGVEPSAATEEISAAYYRRIQGVHPDRHAHERDPVRQRALARLFARFGEAFRVLKSPPMRALYDEELTKGEKRLRPDAQKKQQAEMAAPDPKTPAARGLYQKALKMIGDGDIPNAVLQLKLAVQFEPDSKVIREALDAAAPPAPSDEPE
jgi:curved DNA-binding protein CbpA